MTGLRLGYSASNKTIAKAICTIQGHLVSHPSLTSQYIAYGALKECSDDINNMVREYKKRRDIICCKLDSIANIDYIYPDGAFYVFINISTLKNKFKYNQSFSIDFCNELLNTYNLAVVPKILFGMDDYVRISFACSDTVFLKGLNRLSDFISAICN